MFKQIGKESSYIDWINHQYESDWFQGLSDDEFPLDATCRCGICDGYGTIVTDGKARPCPVSLGLPSKTHVSNSLEKTIALLSEWEGSIPVSFSKYRENACFRETLAFRDLESAWNTVEKIWNPFSRIICGSSGRGKTKSCLIFLYQAAHIGKTCFAFRFSELIDGIKHGVNGYNCVDGIFRNIQKSDVVFVDELGRSVMTGNPSHAQTAWQKIVNLCYLRKVLLCTTNYGLDEFMRSDIMTADLISRLQPRNGYCKWIEDIGYDLRISKVA